MIDDVSDIAAFYNSDSEREDCRLEEHQLEYDLTWRYLDQYLPSQGSILEVAAATGRYTLELAKRGYSLTAVDLSGALIEGCRKSIAKNRIWDGQAVQRIVDVMCSLSISIIADIPSTNPDPMRTQDLPAN